MKFTKMQGAGNDFIIIDNRKKTVKSPDYPVMAKNLCRQRFSIGADGLIFVEKPQNPQTADFSMVFINSDGSFADMCGNGARCLAYYAFVNGIVLKLKGKKMAFETGAGIIKATAGKDKARITLPDAKDIKLDINLKIENREIQVSSVNTGVPHAVIISQDVDKVDVAGLGKIIRNHGQFAPEGTNVDFIEITDRHNIKIRTYERGVEGETYACGTGSVASAFIAGLKKMVQSPVRLHTTGGETLTVYFKQSKKNGLPVPIYNLELEGKVKIIFTGDTK